MLLQCFWSWKIPSVCVNVIVQWTKASVKSEQCACVAAAYNHYTLLYSVECITTTANIISSGSTLMSAPITLRFLLLTQRRPSPLPLTPTFIMHYAGVVNSYSSYCSNLSCSCALCTYIYIWNELYKQPDLVYLRNKSFLSCCFFHIPVRCIIYLL